MLIEQLIGELLLRHNCVVVPSFGGFVAKQTSARIDMKNGVMTPPQKSLLFNRQLINNDGLLIATFAREFNLSYDDAAQEIQKQVEDWHKRLQAGERISLDKVGFLFLDQEKNIGFEQDRFFNLLLQSYGLEKIHFVSEEDIQLIAPAQERIQPIEKPLQVTEESPIIELIPAGEPIIETATANAQRIIPLEEVKSTRKIWRYVAAAVLVPIGFYSFWIPMKTDVLESGVFAVQDFNPFHHQSDGLYEPTAWDFDWKKNTPQSIDVAAETAELDPSVRVWSYAFEPDLYMPVRISSNTSTDEITAPQTTMSTPKSTPTGTKYHLIANCFGNEQNAVNFVQLLRSKGFDACILDVKNGLHRVSAGKSNTLENLQAIQEKAEQSNVVGTWIFKAE